MNQAKKPSWTGHIRSIEVENYRNLSGLTLNFQKGVNVIAGGNGVGKSSILYIISNSFQRVTKSNPWITDHTTLEILKNFSSSLNLKIESLLRKSRSSDPITNSTGQLYDVTYSQSHPKVDDPSISFRRHDGVNNSGTRYRVAPYYSAADSKGLPSTPVIYLGISRLVPRGELKEDEVTATRRKSPELYDQSDLIKEYYRLFDLQLSNVTPVRIENLKSTSEFNTQIEGVDSNTVSVGQENVLIILQALHVLISYAKANQDNPPSILLIDEFDAALHPGAQTRLLRYLRDKSREHNIQIVFTTHSFTVLKEAFDHKDNVLYLKKRVKDVALVPDPTMHKAEMDLQRLTGSDLIQNQSIYIFTEDAEARLFLNEILDFTAREYPDAAPWIQRFKLVDLNMGAESLQGLFEKIREMWRDVPAFAILDGDKHSSIDKADGLSNKIIVLPGRKSPEELLFEYGKKLIEDNSEFWHLSAVDRIGFSHEVFRERVLDALEDSSGTNSKPREDRKKIFNQSIDGMLLLMRHWINDPDNSNEISTFVKNLNAIVHKVASVSPGTRSDWILR